MKIAYVVSQFPCLSETFVLNQISGLIDRGADVYIYADTPSTDPVQHEAVRHYDFTDKLYFRSNVPRPMAKRWPSILLNSHKLPALTTRTDAGSPRIPLPVGLKVLASDPGFMQHRQSFDLIHAHFGPNGLMALALRKLGIIRGPIVTTFHGVDITQYINQYGPGIYDELFRHGEYFLPISRRWRDKLVALGCSPDKVQVHHMGIACDPRLKRTSTERRDTPLQLISVARLVEKKGLEFGIRAVSNLIREGVDVTYDIVGDGPLRNDLQQLIIRLGVARQIRLLGWKTTGEIEVFLNAADILLAPSVTGQNGDQEGIPVALMEAMAKCIPVVSTFHSGIPELIENGESGILVPERDVEALTKALKELLENPTQRTRIGTSARLRVIEDFNIDRLNERLLERFRRIIATPI